MDVELGLTDDLITVVDRLARQMGDIAVWITKAGRVFTTSSLTLPIASCSVPSASGFAGLLKPIWLSLICRNVNVEASAARASPIRPKDFGTPRESVHKIPVPAQTMHSSAPLRLRRNGTGDRLQRSRE